MRALKSFAFIIRAGVGLPVKPGCARALPRHFLVAHKGIHCEQFQAYGNAGQKASRAIG
jgi:hypothetical protein